MADGQLTLHFEITPVRQTLPVRSGPAVLFASFSLYGDAGGDVGLGMYLRPVAEQVIPACDDDEHCRYSVDISVPLKGLPDAIARLEKDGTLIWVSADLTLVRTFGAGQWLQVLAFERSASAAPGPNGGMLGAVVPTHGEMRWSGLFPASQAGPIPDPSSEANPALDYASVVESLRIEAGDTSTPLSAVDVGLNIRFVRSCVAWMELTFHDDLGNHAFYANEIPANPDIHATTTMPIDSPWFLTLDAGEGVQAPVIRLGPIQSDGSGQPVNVVATLDCATRSGTLALVGALTPTPIPTRPPLSSVGPLAPTLPATAGQTAPAASGAPIDPIAAPNGATAGIAIAVVVMILARLAISARRRRSVRS